MMQLDGKAVPLQTMTIRAGFRIEEKDLSGQGSGSDVAEAGIKPQTLAVSGIIKQSNAADLSRLAAMARAVDDNGQRIIYQVTNPTASALQIRRVRFSDGFNVTEAGTTRAWQVSFTLKETDSVPEKVEARQPVAAATEQGAEQSPEASTAPAPSGEEIAASFEGVYNKLGEALA